MEVNQSHSQALPAGYRVGDYILDQVLGQGGFGITYLAHDRDDGTQVVIKENLPRDFAFRETTSRHVLPADDSRGGRDDFEWAIGNFYNEAQLLASLNHPGIVKVIRAFHALGTAYYVMPYVGGASLEKWVESHPLTSPEEVLRLLSPLLSALQYLHSNNILHRDIKPQNILMTPEGDPVLIDFGTARQIISERSHTQVGSPGYTPFEQIQSHGKRGPWTDFYALGATMYRVLSGKTPLDCKDRMGDNEDDPLVPLAKQPELVKCYGKSLLASIDKAMSLKISRRWQTAEEWLKELENTKRGVKTITKNAETSDKKSGKTPPATGKHPWRRVCLGVLLAGAGTCAYIYTQGQQHQAPEDKVSEEAPPPAPEPPPPAPQEAPELIYQRAEDMYASHGNPEEIVSLYKQAAERGYAPALRGLGTCHAEGVGVDCNYEKAANYHRQAATGGDPRGMYEYARCLLTGLGVKYDANQASDWIQKAMEAGNADATALFGFTLQEGLGVKRNVRQAAGLYQQAERADSMAAVCRMGLCYLQGKGVEADAARGAEKLKKAAAAGDLDALLALAQCYTQGTGVAQDAHKARELLDQGLARHSRECLAWLGYALLTGLQEKQPGEDGISYLLQAAEQGSAMAKYLLGDCYTNGIGTAKNANEAARCYLSAAECGYAEALYPLGIAYWEGLGVERSDTTAVQYWQQAAAFDSLPAINRLGWAYLNGRGVEQSNTKALEYYQRTAAQHDPEGLFRVGLLIHQTGSQTEAAKYMQEAVDAGSIEALAYMGDAYVGGWLPQDLERTIDFYRQGSQKGDVYADVCLSEIYQQGIGVEKDEAAAKRYAERVFPLLEKAVDDGDVYATYYLGLLYGYGVINNRSKSIEYLRKAAEKGCLNAGLSLGIIYMSDAETAADAVECFRKAAEEGKAGAMGWLGACYDFAYGVSQDYSEAIKWYRKAVELGDAHAMNQLGMCYDAAKGVPKDYKTAANWYLKAAVLGDKWAQYNLAQSLLLGQGVDKDEKMAVKWLQKSAAQGAAGAMNLLALCYDSARGVPKNHSEAVKYFRKAAELGHAWAQYNLALYYETGQGVKKNKSEAIKWYRKSAEQGNADAKKKLRRLGN